MHKHQLNSLSHKRHSYSVVGKLSRKAYFSCLTLNFPFHSFFVSLSKWLNTIFRQPERYSII
ncbi:MAG: hypothetical protein IJ881_01250 [Neisseriaceae bacterium]|nr:hypothetical protein [Neisseriaceae bacterium]MBR3425893.1 hypothetical protein [Neisseriaceae bacterium]